MWFGLEPVQKDRIIVLLGGAYRQARVRPVSGSGSRKMRMRNESLRPMRLCTVIGVLVAVQVQEWRREQGWPQGQQNLDGDATAHYYFILT